ncbi:hypothetical protein MVEN_00428200 [Mycena venus]|uniref:Uncharacterized protein n=1 Tax=Mycena venus TaxID=2733690 RepID=A0A8H6YUP0_9AGAR|nr:hypothetical protein MVEN_00428200 [Mycena venus]
MFYRKLPLCRTLGRRALHASRLVAHPSKPQEFKVVLDNNTLYVEQPIAEALGWQPADGAKAVQLTLSGWAPNYFAIAPSGSDSDRLARATVESSNNPKMREVLDYLKDR